MKDISPNINVLSHLHRFEFISSDTELDPAIRVITHIHDKFPKPKANEFLLKDSCYVGLQQDDFNHELIFSFGEKEQLVCTGCAHSGVLNILDTVKERIKLPIKTVLGGFHLLDTDDMNQYETMDEINEIASKLKKIYPLTSFYTGHCTGEAVLEKFKDTLKEQIIPFYTGMTINLNN